ncbi:MAG: hypothetical protein H7067_17460 [Burkholderiales bacterium]|nr:hypothetical protein [Opitutaceae bacterium]
MVPLSRPRFPTSRVFALPLALCFGALASAILAPSAVAAPVAFTEASAASELAAELSLSPDAASAEAWLAQHIPAGTALSDQPRFFAAAHEVYFDGEGNVLVFVYRSAAPDRWVAWVSFDAERIGVIDTSATAL